MAAAPPANAIADTARFPNSSWGPAQANHPFGSAQASSATVAHLAKATVDTARLPDPVRAPSQAIHPPSKGQATDNNSGPLPAAQLAQTIVDRARYPNPNQAHSQPKHPPGAEATSSILRGNAPAQVGSTAPQPQAAQPAAKPAATATRASPPSIMSTAPFSLSASLQRHFTMLQPATAAQLPAESKQTAPAQHSLLHRSTVLDHGQAQAAQHTLPRKAALPAAIRGRTASNAALQAKTGANTTQWVFPESTLPQGWSMPMDMQSTPQLAYAASLQHMKSYIGGAPMLDTAVGLVFPPDALQHQLDQQFMEHACERCQLIPKVAQPHAALPYSQSPEAPSTWRAAVLRLIDCLVEVQYQGVVAKDLDASQHHAMLYRTLSMRLEKLQVRLAADPFHSPMLASLSVAFTASLCCIYSMQAVLCSDATSYWCSSARAVTNTSTAVPSMRRTHYLL